MGALREGVERTAGTMSMAFGAPRDNKAAPDKGSFPLDHDGDCKDAMTAFMTCMKVNGHDNTLCRAQSKLYLACRMKHQLMAEESWANLGFHDERNGGPASNTKPA